MGNSVVYIKPYDAEIEYLESTGTQYIDTAIYGSNNSKAEVDLQLLELGASKAVFGCYSANQASLYMYQAGGDSNGKWQFGFGWNANIGKTDTNRHLVVCENFDLTIDGSLIFSHVPRTFTTPYTMLLFNMHNNSGGIYSATGIRIFSCKLYNNSILVRDFIPVRVGTTGYMYDRVSGKLFGNAGTGDFVLGNDVAVPNLRRVVYVPKYDAEVEYLESTGTQYIDTGIIATNNTRIDTGFLRNYGTYNICIIGARPSTYKVNEFAVRPYIDGRFTFIYGNTEGTLNSSSVKNVTYYQCVTNGGFMRLYDSDGNQLQGAQAANNTFTTQYTLYMFGENRGGIVAENSGRKLRIYYLKIYDNTTLVRDFIPVRVGQVGYMYDKVSGQLFGNSGTGNFVLGQDVAKPIVKRYVVPSGLEEGVDYEFVNAFLLTNYNLVEIEPNYPVIFKVKPIEGIQNVVVNKGQNVFFIQNYTSSYKRWQAWNYNSAVTYSVPANGINTFILNDNNFSINNTEFSYPSKWNNQVQLVFNTWRSTGAGTGSIVFYSIKSESMDLRPIRLLRNISGKHTFDRQPKTIGSLGLLDISNQILYFGSGGNISVYND